MYKFILNCWKLKKIDEDSVKIFAQKGYLTTEEVVEILNTAR